MNPIITKILLFCQLSTRMVLVTGKKVKNCVENSKKNIDNLLNAFLLRCSHRIPFIKKEIGKYFYKTLPSNAEKITKKLLLSAAPFCF